MKKGIYKLDFSCGRQGDLEGIFIATDVEVEELIKSKVGVYFGEVLGKHSEIYGNVKASEVSLLSDDSATVQLFIDNGLSSGYNPFEYTVFDFKVEGQEDLDTDDMTVREAVGVLIEINK